MVFWPFIVQTSMYEILPNVHVTSGEVWIFVALLALWATIGKWIYKDANSRGSLWAWQWGFGTPLTVMAGIDVMLLVIVIYLLLRESN